ncbi:MAG: ligand-binding sensor domain-containing protein [Aquaticitalea sp.]
MTITQIKFLISLVALLSSAISFGQNNELRSYTLEDGLPQSQVYGMAQDAIGYLWLGTQGGGLARFDGDNFKTYNENDGLSSNYINTLKFANDTLFIGTKRGLSIRTKSGFQNYEGPQVMHVFRHQNQTFLGTKNGIYRFTSSKKLQKLELNAIINSNQVNAILHDETNFWIATNKGLFNGKSLSESSEFELMGNQNFTSLIQDNSNVLAATFSHGILIKHIKNNSEEWIEELQRINSLSILNNQLWVATDGDGVTVLDLENFQIQRQVDRRSGLAVSNIRDCMMDRQGSIWVATSGGGLYKYFQDEFTHFDSETGLQGNRIYAVHKNGKELWLSNSEAGLVKIDSLGIHPIPTIKNFDNVKIKTINHDSKGNIWAGSDGKGLLFREQTTRDSLTINLADFENIQIDTLKIPEIKNHLLNTSNGFPSDWIRQLHIEKDTIWVATYSDGIVKMQYDSASEKVNILKVFGEKDGMKDLLLKDLKADLKGRIWYGTQSGHVGFIKDNVVKDLGQVLDDKTAINSLLVRGNDLFIGTAGNGVWLANTDNNVVFKKLAGEKQLTSNNCYQLIFDSENNLWVGSERGVDKVVLNQDNKIVDVFHFGRNDGFLGIETCLNAVDMDAKGNLWFGAIYGLTKYEVGPKAESVDIKPTIDFESVEVDYQPIDSLGFYAMQKNEKVLQLKSDQNQMSFTYRTVDLSHPNDIEYRFKLNDDSWSPWSKNNQQNLAGLSYGNHIFYAQSRNYRWQKSEVISFPFTIETPLHEKIWFQWLVIGIALLFILILGWLYFRRIKRRNAEAQAQLQVQNHLLTLEHKALQLQMNPHFIFNVLNGIKGMATTDSQKMNGTINTFATLLREVLNNSRKETISLDQEIKTLKHYIEIEQLMSPKPFNYSIDIDSDIDIEEILIPPMLIQPFVENAIRHGILKGSREGELQLNFKTDTQFLECTIIDNGPGIFHSQDTKTATDHQSMALTVTKERISSIAGKDTLKLEEIKTNVLILGTKISFQIPLQTDF